MRVATTLTCLLLLFVMSPAVQAEDKPAAGEDPTPAELAAMILDGNAGEHLLVAAWLEGADRAELRAVFAELRALRAARVVSKPPAVPAPREVTGARIGEKPRDASDRRGEEDPFASHGGTLVNAEVRILQVPVDAAATLLGAGRPTADRPYRMLTGVEVSQLMRAIEKHDGADVLSAPRILVYDRQQANVSVLNQVSYIQDYDVEVGNTIVVDPIIGIVQEGVLIDFTPTCHESAKTIRVAFEGTFSSLQRPIPEEEIEVAGQKVTIQLPQVEIGRIRETLEVEDGGWVLLGGGVTFQPEKDGPRVERVALVHVTRIEPEDPPGERKK